eukprot:g2415.t1
MLLRNWFDNKVTRDVLTERLEACVAKVNDEMLIAHRIKHGQDKIQPCYLRPWRWAQEEIDQEGGKKTEQQDTLEEEEEGEEKGMRDETKTNPRKDVLTKTFVHPKRVLALRFLKESLC